MPAVGSVGIETCHEMIIALDQGQQRPTYLSCEDSG